jgi:hypothetical protein
VAEFIHEKGAGFAGVRQENDIGFANIYLKSSLFLIFTYCCVINKSSIRTLTIIIATIVTTSKALLATQLLLLSLRIKDRFWSALLFFVVLFIGVIIFLDDVVILFNYLNSTFQGQSKTFLVRLSHFNDLSTLFADNPLNLMFGFGAGSSFYSTYYHYFISNIELDHLNAIRKFGLVWFCVFMVLIIHTVIQTYKHGYRNIALGLLLSFVLAGTNPVLLSPIFFILFIECHFLVRKDRVNMYNGSAAI